MVVVVAVFVCCCLLLLLVVVAIFMTLGIIMVVQSIKGPGQAITPWSNDGLHGLDGCVVGICCGHSVDVPHSAVLSPRHFLESEPALFAN